MAKAGSRELVTLQCTVCKEENYRTSKNKRNTTERLEVNKYCSRCQKTTAHKEKK
ncbi:MAG: 50S ribosomal protein L33 [Bacilli bacterium]|nr:50S ribosomal protein L33 [Bacilli bacterium]